MKLSIVPPLALAAAVTLSACERGPALPPSASPPASPAPAASAPVASVVPTPPVAPATAAPEASARVVRVEPNLVCMVNNQEMGRPQIPTVVEGRTYYGCCAMCKAKLENQVAMRTATDPVTGRTVDKATAVIGRKPSGDVLYFEDVASLEKYAAGG